MTKKRLPLDIHSFTDIQDAIYVDKTQLIGELFEQRGYYFLARPPKFGKSLLLSTIEQIALGNKELFRSYAIAKTDYSWEKHHVLRMDLSSLKPSSDEELRKLLKDMVHKLGDAHGCDVRSAPSLAMKLAYIITTLGKTCKVILLVDEYDAPLLHNLDNPEVLKECIETLIDQFIVVKDIEVSECLYFVLITETGKFKKANEFGGLNNLQDLMLDRRFTKILGYTEEELRTHFHEHLNEFTKTLGTSLDDVVAEMRAMYGGYYFTVPKEAGEALFHPYSVMMALKNKEFGVYGVTNRIVLDKPLDDIVGSRSTLLGLYGISKETLLFYYGYLSIKSYRSDLKFYGLDFPNKETRKAFSVYVDQAKLVSPNNNPLYEL